MVHSFYNSSVITYTATWDRDAVAADLEELNDDDYMLVEEFFDLIETNDRVCEALSCSRFVRLERPQFDTEPIQSALREGYNLSRAKIFDPAGRPLGCRVIYGVDHAPDNRRICILGVMKRDDDYDCSSPFGLRIRAAYDARGLPRLDR